jgi:hypothetical protein
MYEFWCSLRSTDNAVLLGTLFRAARHKMNSASAPLIPDLFTDYLFEIPPSCPSRRCRHARGGRRHHRRQAAVR